MSEFFKTAFEVLKVGGYLATGGFCFHLLSGGTLPFQTMGNVSTLPMDKYNAMASNSKDKTDKKAKKVDMDPAANDTTKANQDSQTKNNADDAAKNAAKPAQDAHGNINKNENTDDLRRALSRVSICGGAVGAVTPECRAKMEEVEKKRQTNEEKSERY